MAKIKLKTISSLARPLMRWEEIPARIESSLYSVASSFLSSKAKHLSRSNLFSGLPMFVKKSSAIKMIFCLCRIVQFQFVTCLNVSNALEIQLNAWFIIFRQNIHIIIDVWWWWVIKFSSIFVKEIYLDFCTFTLLQVVSRFPSPLFTFSDFFVLIWPFH